MTKVGLNSYCLQLRIPLGHSATNKTSISNPFPRNQHRRGSRRDQGGLDQIVSSGHDQKPALRSSQWLWLLEQGQAVNILAWGGRVSQAPDSTKESYGELMVSEGRESPFSSTVATGKINHALVDHPCSGLCAAKIGLIKKERKGLERWLSS